MKGSMMWRLLYVLCALAGCLTGFGLVQMTGAEEGKRNTTTEDSTLVREFEDSVLFDEENNPVTDTEDWADTVLPAIPDSVPTPEEVVKQTPAAEVSEPKEVAAEGEVQLPNEDDFLPEPVAGQAAVPAVPDALPSLGSQWMEEMPEEIPVPLPGMIPTPLPIILPDRKDKEATVQIPQNSAEEVITYPVKIFGQVPVINRSDAYVSYFEFAYDLIEMLEPKVKEQGLNMNALLTKFVIRALLYGVDIEKLDINAPIPRRLAALCLWLAGQLLQEEGCDTSSKTAQKYVTDLGGCSSAEKKAVAFLYEQGVLPGYQVSGQKFYPDAGLKTETGTSWLSGIKRCWD